MGALIFYVAIYFIGYYAAYLINQLAGRALIENRRLTGLVTTLTVGVIHGYKIISSPPPHDHGDGTSYALALYVILPLAIIAAGVLFLMWQDSRDQGDIDIS
jgi:hypothetical protein